METIDDTTYLTGEQIREMFTERGYGSNLFYARLGSIREALAGDYDNAIRLPARHGLHCNTIDESNFERIREDYPFLRSVSTGWGGGMLAYCFDENGNDPGEAEQVLDLLDNLEEFPVYDDAHEGQLRDKWLQDEWGSTAEDCEVCGETPVLREDDYGVEFYLDNECGYFSDKAIQHAWQDHSKVCKG